MNVANCIRVRKRTFLTSIWFASIYQICRRSCCPIKRIIFGEQSRGIAQHIPSKWITSCSATVVISRFRKDSHDPQQIKLSCIHETKLVSLPHVVFCLWCTFPRKKKWNILGNPNSNEQDSSIIMCRPLALAVSVWYIWYRPATTYSVFVDTCASALRFSMSTAVWVWVMCCVLRCWMNKY